MIQTDPTTHGALVTDMTGTPPYFEQGFIFIDSGIGGDNVAYTLKEPVKISIVFDDESSEYILSNDLLSFITSQERVKKWLNHFLKKDSYVKIPITGI